MQQFRDTAWELQHPLSQVGVPPNAVQSVLVIMAKHLNRVVGHGGKVGRSSELDDIADAPRKVQGFSTELGVTAFDIPTTPNTFPTCPWLPLDGGIMDIEIPPNHSSELLVDHLATLNSGGVNTTELVESTEPDVAPPPRQVSREVQLSSPTPSFNLNDFVYAETDDSPSDTSDKIRPLSSGGGSGSSPRGEGSMPIDPGFGR